MRESSSGRSPLGALSGLLGKREALFLLLGKGAHVADRRCNMCGAEFDSPRDRRRIFKLEASTRGPNEERPGDGARLFLENRVLVTSVNPELAPLLEHATNFLGDKVLVVAIKIPGNSGRGLCLFCDRCGQKVLTKVNHENRRLYSWDRLAEIEPRRGGLRAALQKLKRPARAESDSPASPLPSWAPVAALSNGPRTDPAPESPPKRSA